VIHLSGKKVIDPSPDSQIARRFPASIAAESFQHRADGMLLPV
jgi:hypothetical protein